MYHEAATSLDQRDLKTQQVAELIEKDMILLGATAIEDKLQKVKYFDSVSYVFNLYIVIKSRECQKQ